MVSHFDNFTFASLVIATLSIAYFTWRFVENPFRDKNKTSTQVLFVLLFLFFLITRPDFILSLTNRSVIIDGANQQKSLDSTCIIPSNTTTNNQTFLLYTKLPDDRLFDYGIFPHKFDCHMYNANTANKDSKPRFCHIGPYKKQNATTGSFYFPNGVGTSTALTPNKTQDFTIQPEFFLFGDSMSVALTPALEKGNCSGIITSNDGNCMPLLIENDTDKNENHGGMFFFLS
jgi:hypothetical protein